MDNKTLSCAEYILSIWENYKKMTLDGKRYSTPSIKIKPTRKRDNYIKMVTSDLTNARNKLYRHEKGIRRISDKELVELKEHIEQLIAEKERHTKVLEARAKQEEKKDYRGIPFHSLIG